MMRRLKAAAAVGRSGLDRLGEISFPGGGQAEPAGSWTAPGPARWLGVSLACLGLGAGTAEAVLFVSTGDPAYHTSAPTGEWADSGWQFQGQWGSFLGTPVASRFFLTADHIGGKVGDLFNYLGVAYTTVARHVPAGGKSDLVLWEVSQAFPSFAPIYTGETELNRPTAIFGRGTQRGAEIQLNDQVKGWQWGTADHLMRWGTNAGHQVVYDKVEGELLEFRFDRAGGVDEAQLSTGDSGGGVFILDNGEWKLAGINFAVDGPYSLTGGADQGFQAALVDEGGFWVGGEGAWQPVKDRAFDLPGSFYASRVSAQQDWILATVPEPSAHFLFTALVTGVSVTLLRRHRR